MRALILVTVLCLSIAVGKADSVPKKSAALFTPEQIQRARQRLASEKPAYQGWKLIERNLPMVDGVTPGVPHGDGVLIVSNVFGRVCVGKSDTP